jgi:hypothetical protein
VQIWRFAQARTSQDDSATTPNEGNAWTVVARAGSGAGGATTLGDLCPGASFVHPNYCPVGANGFVSGSYATFTDIGQPVVSWGVRCTGVSSVLCRRQSGPTPACSSRARA